MNDAKAKQREYQRRWREANPDYQRKWLAAHPGYGAASYKKWAKANRAWINENSAAKRFGQAMPPWADRDAMRQVYAFAEEFKAKGFDIHVDHIVPLTHPRVCGLHVPWNLRPSTVTGNMKKGSDFPSWFHGEAQQSLAFAGKPLRPKL